MAYLPINDATLATATITAQDIASSTATGANSQPITTGTPTTNSAASFSLLSRETILVMVSGTWTGTLISEGSFDNGITWVNKAVKQIGTGYTANSLTGNFAGAVNVAGLTNYRIRSMTTWTGTATVVGTSSANQHSFYIANNLALRDGTTQSITNTIKPASTVPLATDTSLVVTESPNSPAATVAAQNTGNTALSTIATNTGASATSANQTNGTQQTKITDGTNSVNVLKSDGTAAGQNAALVAPTYLSVPFSITTVSMAATTDIGNYRWFSLQLNTQGTSAVVTPQGSNDNTNWFGMTMGISTGAAVVTATSATGIFSGPTNFRYFRLNVTGISAGTTAGTLVFSGAPGYPNTSAILATQNGTWTVGLNAGTNIAGKFGIDQTTPGTTNLVAANQNGTWTVQPGNTANTTPWLIRQKATTPASTNVSASATTVTVLASNANRIAAQIYNDSTALLYLKLGSTASTTSFTVILASGGYYEVPGGYTGVIDGIWASATGAARVTEET